MLVEKIHKEDKNIVFIYTTCPTIEEARSIALSMIGERLAASADYWFINSIYPWQNVIQDVEQYMLVLTTEKNMSERLMKSVRAMHSYSAPIIACLDTSMVNPTYEHWVDSTLSSNTPFMSKEEKIMKIEREEENGYHYGRLK